MIEFLFHSNNWPFALAACLLAGLMAIELMSTFIGFQLSGMLDDILPDFDIDLDADDVPVLTKFIGWIRVGNVPVLIIFLSFLFLFSTFGYLMQNIYHGLTDSFMVWWIAIWLPIILSVPFLRIFSRLLSKFVIREESTAISVESLVGAIATITLNTAVVGKTVEAKVKDKHRRTHYVRVQPEEGEFQRGSKVFLMKHIRGNVFIVTKPPQELLS